MELRRLALVVGGTAATLMIVAGCTSSSDGTNTPSATATVTATDTVSSADPPTGSGVPASSTPPATGATSGGSTGNASGPGLCTPTVATFAVGPDEGAAGTSYFSVHVTNASQSPCVTTGYPGIALLNAAGQQILQATRSGSGQPPTITLQPGEQATAQVGASAMGTGGSACSVTSPAFLFTLPDNTDSTKITHNTLACSVRVEAFVKGSGV